MTPRADVVIVGAGSAGCVLAARLSENPSCQVLLVEAGPLHVGQWPPGLLDASLIPAGHEQTWQYTSALAAGRDGLLHRGRGGGGSSAVNGGYFVRATPADVDTWPGLTYTDLLASFVRSETDADFGGPRHGERGPMPVARRPSLHPVSERFRTACRAAGFPEVPDMNERGDDGVGRLPLNIRDGVRVNAALAYLLPVLDRPNLAVRSATVTGIRITGGRASSVHFALHPHVGAGTVVLCAGAIETPHLLLLSGVGPADELRRLDISVHADLPVGRGFSDHPDVAVHPHVGAEQSERNSAPGLEVVLTTPTVEIRPYTASFAELVPGSGAGPDAAVGVALLQPESRGTLTLRSTDPDEAPRIAHHYLESAGDRDALADGVRLTHELFGQRPPDGGAQWIGRTLGTSQHMVGTCALGSVVDTGFAVRGVENLHVVDASVIPTVPRRGPHASVIALAEHAAGTLATRLR